MKNFLAELLIHVACKLTENATGESCFPAREQRFDESGEWGFAVIEQRFGISVRDAYLCDSGSAVTSVRVFGLPVLERVRFAKGGMAYSWGE